MRKLFSILIFSAALLTGVFFAPSNVINGYEKLFPLFKKSEVENFVGRRVRNKFSDEKLFGMKCSNYENGMLFLESDGKFPCKQVKIGETGTITGIHKADSGFALIVTWDDKDEHGRDMYSYDGRFSSRVFLEFQ